MQRLIFNACVSLVWILSNEYVVKLGVLCSNECGETLVRYNVVLIYAWVCVCVCVCVCVWEIERERERERLCHMNNFYQVK
jgi:hypothetical protein